MKIVEKAYNTVIWIVGINYIDVAIGPQGNFWWGGMDS